MFNFLNGADGKLDYKQLAGFGLLVLVFGVAFKHAPLPSAIKP